MSSPDTKKNVLLALGLFAMAAGLALMVFWRFLSPPAPQFQMFSALPAGKALEKFELSTAAGRPFTQNNFKGQLQLVFPGYTYCPDVCPLELKKIADVLKRFDVEKIQVPAVFFLTVDPERDLPAGLQKYTAYFDERITGITGSNREIANLAGQLGVSYSRGADIDGKRYLVKAGADMPEGAGEYYDVNHSSRFYVINGEGEYIGSFPPPHHTDILYQDLKILLRQ
jgi:protein SCO1/2